MDSVWKVFEATTLTMVAVLILCLLFMCFGCSPIVHEHTHEHKHQHTHKHMREKPNRLHPNR